MAEQYIDVQCRCGWKGKQSELVVFRICPKCGSVFEPYPAESKDAEIDWLKSSIVSLLTLADAKDSPLTNAQVATICRHTLARYCKNALKAGE